MTNATKTGPIAIGGVLGRYKEVRGKSHMSKSGAAIDVFQVESDETKWVLGYEAVDHFKLSPILVVARDGLARYRQSNFSTYSKIGLAQAIGDKVPAQILLVTSTPANDYLDSDVIRRLEDVFLDVHKVRKNDVRLAMNVVKYEAMSETEAILYDMYLDKDGYEADPSYAESETIVINAGFGTTDISFFNGLEYLPLTKETVKVSFLDVLEQCKTWLSDTLKRDITVQDVATQLSLQKDSATKTFKYAGDPVVGFHGVYVKAVQSVFDELLAELNLIIPDPDRYPRIIVGGGAANGSIWGDQFRSWCKRRVKIPNAPEFAAVRGMRNYGRYVKTGMEEPTLFVVAMDTGNGELKIYSDAME